MTSQDFSYFFDKNLHIDYSKIILNNESINKQKIYEGTGSITRNPEGQLELKLSFLDDNSWLLLIEHIEAIGETQGNLTVVNDKTAKIGHIVEESEYFSLSAFDSQGREWKSTRVLIVDRSYNGNQVTFVAKLHEIYCTIPVVSNKKASICLNICGKINFPHNSLISKEEESEYFDISAAHFYACDYEFIIKHKDDFTIIELKSDCDQLPNFIESRICEALQFVLGDFIEWSTLELNEQDHKTIRIQSLYNQNYKPKLRPPLHFENLDTTKDIWKLYEVYLKYILQYNEKTRHPISGWISRILESRALYLESEMLTIAVAVESLLEIEPLKRLSESKLVSLETQSNNLQSQILLVRDTIKQLNLDNSLQNRLNGFLDKMNSVTTTDRLRNLENEGLIDKKLRNTWQKIRNKAAHGYVLQPEKFGEYLKLSKRVTVLFNHLVFLAIGYTGNYTDYSEIGCPKKEYNKTSN